MKIRVFLQEEINKVYIYIYMIYFYCFEDNMIVTWLMSELPSAFAPYFLMSKTLPLGCWAASAMDDNNNSRENDVM